MRSMTVSGVLFLAACLPLSADGPTFEAASVTLAGDAQAGPITGGPGTSDPGRFRAPRIALFNLLARAFGVSTDQIVGPSWIRDVVAANNFTVVATMPPDTTKEQFEKMLQNLLVERFHLVFHHETRNFPGYELVVDKGGPKFKEVAPSQNPNAGAPPDPQAFRNASIGADGFPNLPGPRIISRGWPNGRTVTKFQERTVTEFVSTLGFTIGSSQGKSVLDGNPQPRVADKTGLTGKYTFILEYYDASSASLAARLGAQTGGGAPAAADAEDTGPPLFDAIQKQLGLRLNKTADVPVDVIVIESLGKLPTPN